MHPIVFLILPFIFVLGFLAGFIFGRRRDNDVKNVKVIQNTPRKFL